MPNPLVREYARSERKVHIHTDSPTSLSVCNVLFKGHQNNLFMIFNPSQIKDNKKLVPEDHNSWRLGIIDLDNIQEISKPFPSHDFTKTKAFSAIYDLDDLGDSIISKWIECKKPIYSVKSNPTLFVRNNRDTILVFPTNKALVMYTLGKK